MRRENRTNVQLIDDVLQGLGSGLVGDLGHGFGQPAVLFLAGAQSADAVHLLGGVGEVEIEGEGADQLGGFLKRQ